MPRTFVWHPTRGPKHTAKREEPTSGKVWITQVRSGIGHSWRMRLVLKSLGFPVSAWTRTPKPDAEVPIFHGDDQLEPFLKQTDIAVCLLPLTRETEGIFCARTFAMMPKGSMLVNIGRGGHVVEKDLIEALDSGRLSHASLDALKPEPLPAAINHGPLNFTPSLSRDGRSITYARTRARDGQAIGLAEIYRAPFAVD